MKRVANLTAAAMIALAYGLPDTRRRIYIPDQKPDLDAQTEIKRKAELKRIRKAEKNLSRGN